jgi:hypothetical protein
MLGLITEVNYYVTSLPNSSIQITQPSNQTPVQVTLVDEVDELISLDLISYFLPC